MQKENKKNVVWVVAGIVILVAVFYGGVVYGKSQIPVKGQGMQAFGQNNVVGIRGTRSGGGLGGFTAGQIISKDAQSITIKLMDGGSKIIFLDSNTKISKMTDGSMADLATGIQVSITGTANADGSINAQTVQIRPNLTK